MERSGEAIFERSEQIFMKNAIMILNSYDKGFILIKDVEITDKPYRKQEIVRVGRQIEAIRGGGLWHKVRFIRKFRYILEEFDKKVRSTIV